MKVSSGKVRIGAIAIFGAAVFAAATLLIAGTPGSAGDTTADMVLGQLDFAHSAVNMMNAQGLNNPDAVAIDASATPNQVYVADPGNNRVLGWRDAASFTNGTAADLVIGQPNFTSAKCNNGGVSANSLCYPQAVAVDRAGNLYVADYNNSRVLEYTTPFAACAGAFPCVGSPANEVLGQEGSFTSESCNNDSGGGNSTANDLCYPRGLAVDGAGSLYVADSSNSRVLEYNTPLTNTTADELFGQGGSFTSRTCNNGGVSANSLCYPEGLAVDGAGNLYLADSGNSRVLEYNTPLTNTTADEVFGQGGSFTSETCNNGGVSANSLCDPQGLAVDGAGNLYVADPGDSRVLEYNTPLTNTTADEVFGQGASFTSETCNNGGVSANSLCYPCRLAVDGAGNLYLADSGNNRVLEYNTPLTNTTADMVLGQLDFTHSAVNMMNAQGLNNPDAVAIDASATPNRVYVADPGNNRVLGWRDAASFTNGTAADLVIGQPDFTSAKCNNGGVSANSLCYPQAVAVDRAGNLYVTDANNSRVLEYTTPFAACAEAFPCVGSPANEILGQEGNPTMGYCNLGGISATSLCLPRGVAVDGAGNLYVADSGNDRVLAYKTPVQTNQAAYEIFGQYGCDNGGASANSLCGPQGLAVDGAGNLYLADSDNSRVLEYNTPSTNTTADEVFGQGGSFTSRTCNNGGVSANSLCYPVGVGVDAAGNLYVADAPNHRVLEYNTPLTNPTADTVFGQDGSFTTEGCNSDTGGGGSTADDLCYPAGVGVDAAGNLYVADSGNSRVLEYDQPLATPTPTPTATATQTATATPTPISERLTIRPHSLAFGHKVTVGTTSKPKTVTIKNAGKRKTGVAVNIELESASPPVFAVSSECKETLMPGESCKVAVTFTPPDTTPRTGSLTVFDNVTGTPQSVPLSGTGKAAK